MLDTNVLVSALLRRDSVPGRILRSVWDGELQLLVSTLLLDELTRVLEYPKIRKRLVAAGVDTVSFLELLPFFVVPTALEGVSVPMRRDVDDWMVLATLVAGEGEWLITGDEDLLAFAGDFPVINPADFVDRFLS